MTETTSNSPIDDQFLSRWHHEDLLVNHRLTWLLGVQALLLAGYAQLAIQGKTTETRSNGGATTQTIEAAAHEQRIRTIESCIPAVAIAMAFFVYCGVLAAHCAQAKLTHGRHGSPLGVHRWTTLGGWGVGLSIPATFIVTWLAIALELSPFEIGGTAVAAAIATGGFLRLAYNLHKFCGAMPSKPAPPSSPGAHASLATDGPAP